MEKSNASFFVMNAVLLLVGISFILVVFELTRFAFLFQLGLLLIFIFFLGLAMHAAYNNKKWGWTLVAVTLILLLVDTIVLSVFGAFGTAHIVAIIFSIVGLVIAFLNLGRGEEEATLETEEDKTKAYYPNIDKVEPKEDEEPKKEEPQPVQEEVKVEEVKVKSMKKAAPKAPFVGGAETKKFHTSKCGWARIMKRKNKIYFNSRRKAEKAGFKPHECVR